ncbi:hypothetical protein SAMN05877838_1638 [Hoeflea halophila]|uniref:Uncharacterized protein n=1 Tax=Hoeflea halophila TaxID=714899 RepID=A0A286I9G1_9HYPH|nr:hypothetical protein [Hoeflea halophila]SOE16758.1 hypothetical protein SAMN05877838_1638 [Hoeflea halophila]
MQRTGTRETSRTRRIGIKSYAYSTHDNGLKMITCREQPYPDDMALYTPGRTGRTVAPTGDATKELRMKERPDDANRSSGEPELRDASRAFAAALAREASRLRSPARRRGSRIGRDDWPPTVGPP